VAWTTHSPRTLAITPAVEPLEDVHARRVPLGSNRLVIRAGRENGPAPTSPANTIASVTGAPSAFPSPATQPAWTDPHSGQCLRSGATCSTTTTVLSSVSTGHSPTDLGCISGKPEPPYTQPNKTCQDVLSICRGCARKVSSPPTRTASGLHLLSAESPRSASRVLGAWIFSSRLRARMVFWCSANAVVAVVASSRFVAAKIRDHTSK
jgi:hypothetical protein